jgi:hypothetical protein
MWLLIILTCLCALLLWLLLSPVVLAIDSRIPVAEIKWTGIGSGNIRFNGEWWLHIQVLFYHKNICLSATKKAREKKASKKIVQRKPLPLSRLMAMLRTFRVSSWQIAIDTGDPVRMAQLYPLNFLPGLEGHTRINFNNENYVQVRIKNRPVRLLIAYIK